MSWLRRDCLGSGTEEQRVTEEGGRLGRGEPCRPLDRLEVQGLEVWHEAVEAQEQRSVTEYSERHGSTTWEPSFLALEMHQLLKSPFPQGDLILKGRNQPGEYEMSKHSVLEKVIRVIESLF